METSVRKQAAKTFSRVFGAATGYILIGIALVYLCQILTALIVGGERLIELSDNPYYIWGLQVFAMYLVSFPLFLLFIRKLPTASREKTPISLTEFGCLFLICQGISMVGSMFSNWLITVFEALLGHEIPDTTSEIIEITPVWIIFLVVVVIGPFIEEMIFRKLMIDKLSIYGDRLAVVVTSVAFGIFHGNFYQLFYATALGFVLGYVYTKTRRSEYNCVLHMVINFMGTIPALLTQDAMERINALPEDAMIQGSLLNDYFLIMFTSYVQMGLAIAGIVFLIRAIVKKQIHFRNECDIPLEKSDYPRVMILNVGAISFIIVCIAQCILSLFAA